MVVSSHPWPKNLDPAAAEGLAPLISDIILGRGRADEVPVYPAVRLVTPSGTREVMANDWGTIRTVVFTDPILSGTEIHQAWFSSYGEAGLLDLLRQRLRLAFTPVG